jgi:hypothetical protein
MIRLTCPECQAKLNAKEELAGQTRKCPKCGTTLQIPEADAGTDQWAGLDDVAPDQHVHEVVDHQLPALRTPDKLLPSNRYLICDKSKLFAMWDASGQGWMLKTTAGLVSAKRNPEQLPAQGEFTLVELTMARTDEGLRLRGIQSYDLADRWALTTLEQDDHRILSHVTGPGSLNREQKNAVLGFLREQFMRSVWEEARDVLEYLTNLDFHSQGVG